MRAVLVSLTINGIRISRIQFKIQLEMLNSVFQVEERGARLDSETSMPSHFKRDFFFWLFLHILLVKNASIGAKKHADTS